MRSIHEILFRLRQEAGNLRLLAFPPSGFPGSSRPPEGLPSPKDIARRLDGTTFARQVNALACKLMQGSVPLLGYEFEIGSRPSWRKDYVSGIESGTPYFRRLPYLDAKQVGDHKVIWELNRHQHLALLAMASLLTDDRKYAEECARQLETWFADNPFQRGINWASALEVAFRALSWIWILAWMGDSLPPALCQRLATELYRHGAYLEYNLSVYFSPNTHLLGEAVILHLLGRMFPDWPRSRQWEAVGARITEQQMDFQMQSDGVHFEQSSYYHVYALDFFLLHRIFARRIPESYDAKLRLGLEYLRAMLGPQWQLPLIGDDDGGRLFHPFGERSYFGRATLATASVLYNEPAWLRDPADLQEQAVWWLGPQPSRVPSPEPLRSRIFPASGMVVLTEGDTHITFDAGPFGWGGAGHSHSDTLSITATLGDKELLIDPGTYTYVGDPAERDAFRGSAAHNTIRINGRDQATPAGPFRWLDKPQVSLDAETLTGICRYSGFTHRRRLSLNDHELTIIDDIEGEGEHVIEQFWHLGSPEVASRLKLDSQAAHELTTGWRSRVLGHKEPCPVLRVWTRSRLPLRLTTILLFTAI